MSEPDSRLRTPRRRGASVIRWIARGLSLALVLFWGAFLVEHLAWFGSTPKPPLEVWLLQGVHLALVAGYLLTFKWERTGSVVVVVSAIVFFTFTAGSRALWFILVSILPVALYAYAGLNGRLRMRQTA